MNASRWLVAMALVASTMVLEGCMWARNRVNDPTIVDRAANIRVGVTKGSMVADILGAQPMMRMPGKETKMLGFSYADTKVNGLVLIVLNFSRSETVTDTLYVECDAKTDVVRNVYIPKPREIEWRFWPFDE